MTTGFAKKRNTHVQTWLCLTRSASPRHATECQGKGIAGRFAVRYQETQGLYTAHSAENKHQAYNLKAKDSKHNSVERPTRIHATVHCTEKDHLAFVPTKPGY